MVQLKETGKFLRQNWRNNLRKKLISLIAALACVALLRAASPKLEVSWKSPIQAATSFKKIMVLALNGKAENRAEFEDLLVAAISRPGQKAEQSYPYLPRPDATPIDINYLRALVKDEKFDAIVVARLTKNEDKTTYV